MSAHPTHLLLSDLPRPVAFVLSGGAAFGSVQVGMLRAAADAGLVPDLVVGTSVGALNGVVLAADPSSAVDRLTDVWLRLDRATVFGGSRAVMIGNRLTGRSRSLCRPDRLQALIREHLPAETFSELPIRAAVVATCATTAEAVLLDDGLLTPALLATSAIPGVFPEVEIDGRRLIDGGVAANLPALQAARLGARTVVLLDASPGSDFVPPADGVIPGILRSVSLMVRAQRHHALATLESEGLVIVDLPSPTPPDIGTLNFDHTAELMEASYRAARGHLGLDRPDHDTTIELWPPTRVV